jgi:hypothetical protein
VLRVVHCCRFQPAVPPLAGLRTPDPCWLGWSIHLAPPGNGFLQHVTFAYGLPTSGNLTDSVGTRANQSKLPPVSLTIDAGDEAAQHKDTADNFLVTL